MNASHPVMEMMSDAMMGFYGLQNSQTLLLNLEIT
jgi:hypothetical protein